MSANSRIKKHGSIPHLYIDEITRIFIARVYHAGATRSKSLKTKSETIAKQRLSGAIKEILTTDKTKLKNKLVRDYYSGFLKSLEAEDLSKATMTRYSVSWRHHVEPFWADLREDQVSQDTYSNYLSWHRDRHGGKIFNHLKLVRGLIKYMLKSGAKIQPIDAYLPKKEKDSNNESKGTYIEGREIKKILLAPTLSARERLMIELAYTYGFRLGELCNLRWDRMKVHSGMVTIHLKAQDTKTRKGRQVPLTRAHGELMKQNFKTNSSEFAFPAAQNNKRPVSKQVIDRAWIKAKDWAGIRRRMRFHDLRHTAATNLADLGIDAVKACAILGMTLKIYMGTYVKTKSLNLSSVVDEIEKLGRDA